MFVFAIISSMALYMFSKQTRNTAEPVYNGHPWDHAKWLFYRGGLLVEVDGTLGLYQWMDFGTYPTGWYIEGDLLSQVAASTGSTVCTKHAVDYL